MSISISRRDLHGIFSKYQNAIDNPDLANKRLAKRGLTESNAEHGPRPVYRMGRPLKDLSGDPNDHSLFVHHGVYIPPVMWEFQKGQKNKIGKHKLRISADPNPDLSKWKTYELAGTTHRSDAEINNSCRAYKKASLKNYSFLSRNGVNCQDAADDVSYDVTDGKSRLQKAPCRRKTSLVLEGGIMNSARKLKETAKYASQHKIRTSIAGPVDNAQALEDMLQTYRRMRMGSESDFGGDY